MVSLDDVRVMKKHYSAQRSRGSSGARSRPRSRGMSAVGELVTTAERGSNSRNEEHLDRARNKLLKEKGRTAARRTTTGPGMMNLPNTPKTANRKFADYLANSSVITKGRIEHGVAQSFGGPRSMLQYASDPFDMNEDSDGVKDH